VVRPIVAALDPGTEPAPGSRHRPAENFEKVLTMTTGRVLLGTLVAALSVVWPSVPAGAHASAVASWPAAGQLVTAAPDRVTVEFSTELLPDTLVSVVDPSGTSLADGDPVVQGRFVTQALADSDLVGPYIASFRVLGSDLHAIDARIDFVVDPAGTATDNPAGDPPDLVLDDPSVEAKEEESGGSGSGPLLLLAGFGGVVLLIVVIRLAAARKAA
jgi:methionine-rich copper-binding protein CopC